MIAASDYPFLSIFWTMLVFVAWVIWLWILVTVLIDVFGREDLSGWGKAAWALFVIVLPYLGVFIYLITQGKEMAQRRSGMRPGGSMPYTEPPGRNRDGAAEQIARGKELLESGAITQAEFDQLKRKALA